MKAKKLKSGRVLIIGLGGIGRFVAQIVPKMLNSHWAVSFIDGDKYDQSNVPRQCSQQDVGEYKAVVAARPAMSLVMAYPVCEYITDDCFGEFEETITLLAIDNHKTRKLVSDSVSNSDNAVLISGGNELYDGNVQVYIRKAGKNLTPSLGQYHPEIEEPKDKAPWEKSCEELAIHEPQIVATNLAVASVMVNCFQQILDGKFDDRFSEIYLDSKTNRVLPVERTV